MLNAKDDDSFDKLLLALSDEGFGLPFMARIRDYPDKEELKRQDDLAWLANRTALLKALTNSGWVAG